MNLGRLGDEIVVLHLRCRKIELVGGLDVRYFFEKRHQLRQVEELGKARPCPVTGAFRRKLQGCGRLSKAGGPAVEMAHAQLLKPVILQIPLDGIKLGHAV